MAGPSKQEIRTKTRQKLERITPTTHFAKSVAIARCLRRLKVYREAKTVMCYISKAPEVNTEPLLDYILADGKRLVAPITLVDETKLLAAEVRDLEQDLIEGPYGIPQPKQIKSRLVSARSIDLVVVPGVAFDRAGHRLGQGKGYFDRFLAKVPAKTPRVGICFKTQILKSIPVEAHDQPMTRLVVA